MKELTTWAKDLRGTLQEVEKGKELDRANFKHQLESLKQDHVKELAECRSQLEGSFAKLEKTRSQLTETRYQLAGRFETKRTDGGDPEEWDKDEQVFLRFLKGTV